MRNEYNCTNLPESICLCKCCGRYVSGVSSHFDLCRDTKTISYPPPWLNGHFLNVSNSGHISVVRADGIEKNPPTELLNKNVNESRDLDGAWQAGFRWVLMPASSSPAWVNEPHLRDVDYNMAPHWLLARLGCWVGGRA